MGSDDVEIRPAKPSDLEEVLGLLLTVDIPHDGVKEHFNTFIVMRDVGVRLQGYAVKPV